MCVRILVPIQPRRGVLPHSRHLSETWKCGLPPKTRTVDYEIFYAKYSTYVPEAQAKDFDKRMRDLVRYGGCYVFIAWQLGLGSLIPLRAR
jgi:hypothetical protein